MKYFKMLACLAGLALGTYFGLFWAFRDGVFMILTGLNLNINSGLIADGVVFIIMAMLIYRTSAAYVIDFFKKEEGKWKWKWDT